MRKESLGLLFFQKVCPAQNFVTKKIPNASIKYNIVRNNRNRNAALVQLSGNVFLYGSVV